MFGSSLLTKGKGVALSKYGTESERLVAPYLFDDSVKIMSSFEMNKIASLTYGEKCCEEIFDLLGRTLSKASESTVLTLQKTLVLMKHLVIYGSEDCIENAFGTGHLVMRLLNYNTVLHGGKATNIFNQIKGGSVDRGGPVRTAAKDLHEILSDKNKINKLRLELCDPNSLVPVGNKEDIAFQSADLAKKGIARQKQLKSNLAKSRNGFGSGFNPRDSSGRMIVGAAHSIEEMLQKADKEKTRYCDDTNDPQYQRRQEQLQREQQKKEEMKKKRLEAPAPDLLDFNLTSPPAPSATYATPVQTTSVFDVFDAPTQQSSSSGPENFLQSTLKVQQTQIDKLKQEMERKKPIDLIGMNIGSNQSNLTPSIVPPFQDMGSNSTPKKSIMEPSSTSGIAISSFDVIPSMSTDIPPELPSTFDSLSLNPNSTETRSASAPTMPNSPPPPPPPPLEQPPTLPSNPHAHEISGETAPYDFNSYYNTQSTNGISALGSVPKGGSTFENPIQNSGDVFESAYMGSMNAPNFQAQNNSLNNNSMQVNMKNFQSQQEQNKMAQQSGMFNAMMAQMMMMNGGNMMTPEQQQLFLQQQQMMMTMMNQQNTANSTNAASSDDRQHDRNGGNGRVFNTM